MDVYVFVFGVQRQTLGVIDLAQPQELSTAFF